MDRSASAGAPSVVDMTIEGPEGGGARRKRAVPAFRPPRFWRPEPVVFVSSACIMVLELVAGRIIAPQVGVSLYTWTSVIGVVLAGMSLGNYIGGKLADRYASLRLLGVAFLLGGITSLGILAVDSLAIASQVEWSIIAEILILIAALFLPPALVLGTISPIVMKLAVEDLARAGSTLGRISAAGTAGSIVGTFVTGFWLIAWFGTHTVVLGVAVVLLAIGLLFLASGRIVRDMALTALVVLAPVGIVRAGWTRSACLRETNYFCINVRDDERNGKPVRVLVLDRLVHSYSSLDDPTNLVYYYEQTYAELTAYQAERHEPLRVFFIGAYSHLGLTRDTRIASYNEDARTFLTRAPDRRYDVIYGDAFNDFSVPYHLTTKEFNDRVKAWLTDDGLYVVNIIDGAVGRFLRAYVRTLGRTFEHVYVIPRLADWRGVSRDTFVIVASRVPLNEDAFAPDSRFVEGVLSAAALEALLDEGEPAVLTDRHAPVEQMLAPVFLGRTTQ
ncbi:MAG: fused MFS/spermidine synthase [Anaerolineae bacterium]|nr:fused MFS/spermidine synthase [Anaerolineae bacterium]